MPVRNVNVLFGPKKRRMIVHCPTCPLTLKEVNGTKKTACLHIVVKSKKSGKLRKANQCEWYIEDSIKRDPINGIANIGCSA